MNGLPTALATITIFFASSLACAQQFTLAAPSLNLTSRAVLSAARLEVIDAQGTVNRYDRDASLDSDDGQWVAYRSPQTGKILRWPQSNTGSLQIGTAQGGTIRYSASQMQIQQVPGSGPNLGNRPLAGSVLPPPLNNSTLNSGFGMESASSGSFQETIVEYQGKQWNSFSTSDLFTRVIGNPANRLPNQQAIHLVSYDAGGTPWAVVQRGATLGCTSQVSSQAMWWVAPAGPGMVRLQMLNNGQVWAVSAASRNNLRLDLVGQDPRQLWRVSHGHGIHNQFLLENAHFIGNYLSHLGRGSLGMQPWLALPTQMWVPIAPPPAYVTTLEPFWRNVNREIRPNPPLPPAEVELTNSHKYALMILVGDLRSGQVVKELRVEPNQSTTITVERDPGSTLVEVVEIMTPGGGWNRQEYVTQIPPVNLYDLSVYEEFLQSIAIDRTGKSPNKIEDVNYQPKSVGLLILPAGSSLPERGQMDAYAQSKAADNAGAVRRMDLKRFEKPKADPLESILEGIQKKNPPVGGRSF